MLTDDAPIVEPRAARSTARFTPYIAASAAYLVFIVRNSATVEGRRSFPMFDDAMISMTYARNLAHGHGLVWNAGGARVEGITNPLWTFLIAIPSFLGVPDGWLGLVVALMSAALLLTCGALAGALVRELAPDRPAAATIATWFVLFCYPLVYWALRGMEVALMTACALGAAVLTVRLTRAATRRDWRLLAAVCAVGLLTRIDFVVFVVPVAVFLVLQLSGAARTLVVRTLGLAVVGTLVLQEIARRVYYHAWVPNTYTLKVAGVPLSDRLERGMLVDGYAAMVTCAAVFVVAGFCVWHRQSRLFGFVAVMALAPFAYVVYVGGDAWEWMRYADRYLLPGIAFLLCLAAIGVNDLVAGGTEIRRARSVVIGILAVLAALVARRVTPGGSLIFPARADRGALPGQAVALLPVLVVLLAAGSGMWLTRRRGLAIGLLAAAVLLPLSLPPVLAYVRDGGAVYSDLDANSVVQGRLVRAVTRPGARVAVTAAGAVIYASGRDGVDLLGKSDPAIAHGPVHSEIPFWPGHVKWNYELSVGGDRPDVVANIWFVHCGEGQKFVDWGYRLASPAPALVAQYGQWHMLVLTASPFVRFDSLVLHSAAETAASVDHNCLP